MTDVHAPQSQPESAAEDEAARSFSLDQTGTAEGGSRRSSQPPAANAGWLRWGWRQLTSMRTALVLLFLLALGSIPGSVLPQQGSDPGAVQQYYASHPTLAPWLNHLGLFNVFAAPWFAAIYLLLFASLVGCVVPRTFRLVGAARTPPPRAPRNLARLPQSSTYASAPRPRRRSRELRRCSTGAGSGCGARRATLRTTGYRRRRGTCASSATCCSTCRCSACCSRSRRGASSATRPTSSWLRASRSSTRPPRSTSSPGAACLWQRPRGVFADAEQVHRELHRLWGVARAAVQLRCAGLVCVIAWRQAGDLPHPDQRPALRRLAEGLPHRARVRAGVQGHRGRRQGGVRRGDPLHPGQHGDF